MSIWLILVVRMCCPDEERDPRFFSSSTHGCGCRISAKLESPLSHFPFGLPHRRRSPPPSPGLLFEVQFLLKGWCNGNSFQKMIPERVKTSQLHESPLLCPHPPPLSDSAVHGFCLATGRGQWGSQTWLTAPVRDCPPQTLSRQGSWRGLCPAPWQQDTLAGILAFRPMWKGFRSEFRFFDRCGAVQITCWC